MTRGKLLLIGSTLLLASLVAFTLFDPNRFLLGVVRGDSWFQGRPSSYWRRVLREEDQPALQTPEAVPVLGECLQDRNPGVRLRAAQMLGALGTQARDAVPYLVKALNDESGSPSRESVFFLGALLAAKDAESKVEPPDLGGAQAAYFVVADALVEIDPEAARNVLGR
jgi:hypothetical protein